MEFVFALPLLLLPALMPLLAGLMARSFGRKFWTWFIIGIPLPFVANIILLCLPNKNEKKKAVENEELFDHLFTDEHLKHITNYNTDYSARA